MFEYFLPPRCSLKFRPSLKDKAILVPRALLTRGATRGSGQIQNQPRTQALSTTRLAGGKTLVQAGHVSPRFWEITNFLHKGGGLSLFYRSSCRYQFDKVQSVCILTNACNFNERQELVLQNQWVRCLCICILCGLHLRRRYARSLRSSIRTGVFQFHLGKTAKN